MSEPRDFAGTWSKTMDELIERLEGLSGQIDPCLDNSGYGLSMRDPGMTLRDWFAGQALISTMRLVTGYESLPDEGMAQTFARLAYKMADAMLTEREATKI